jgi:hypothetical protein
MRDEDVERIWHHQRSKQRYSSIEAYMPGERGDSQSVAWSSAMIEGRAD